MKKKGELILILSRFPDRPAQKYTFSKKSISLLFGCLAVVVVCLVLSSLHYYQMWNRTADHVRLKAELDQLRKENEEYQLTANQLAEKISGLEVNVKRLRFLTGLEQDGFGGRGGPLSFDAPVSSLSSRDLIRHFNSLDRRRITLETELRQMQDHYNTRSMLLAATPSIMPVRGYPSDSFGYRIDPFTGAREFHPGIDISAPRGQKVVATADGIVSFSGRRFGYGNLVVVHHRFRIETRYGHLDRIAVKVGQRVKKGDVIGYVGSTGRTTGVHLHYEVRLNDQPLNPLRFIRETE